MPQDLNEPEKKKTQKPKWLLGFVSEQIVNTAAISAWRTLSAALDFETEGRKILSGSYVG